MCPCTWSQLFDKKTFGQKRGPKLSSLRHSKWMVLYSGPPERMRMWGASPYFGRLVNPIPIRGSRLCPPPPPHPPHIACPHQFFYIPVALLLTKKLGKLHGTTFEPRWIIQSWNCLTVNNALHTDPETKDSFKKCLYIWDHLYFT